MWPLHTWLPDAHTAAPTVGSVLLAGVLLKMGTYGMVRIVVPTLPDAMARHRPVPRLPSPSSASSTARWPATAQDDLKRVIAFSSVGHMGFVLLGISTLVGGRASTPRCSATSRTASSPACSSSWSVASSSAPAPPRFATLPRGLYAACPASGIPARLRCVASLGPAGAGRVLGRVPRPRRCLPPRRPAARVLPGAAGARRDRHGAGCGVLPAGPAARRTGSGRPSSSSTTSPPTSGPRGRRSSRSPWCSASLPCWCFELTDAAGADRSSKWSAGAMP